MVLHFLLISRYYLIWIDALKIKIFVYNNIFSVHGLYILGHYLMLHESPAKDCICALLGFCFYSVEVLAHALTLVCLGVFACFVLKEIEIRGRRKRCWQVSFLRSLGSRDRSRWNKAITGRDGVNTP